MKNNNSNALRWLLVALFSVLGLGLLTGSAFAQEDAQAQQVGDNDVVVEQETTAKSGDSVAGSQVVGVVGGSPTIQGQNSSSGATATSGDVTAVNDLTVNAGPSATTTAAPAPINGIGATSSHTGGEAQAQQIGDNNVVVNQETNVSSGDCVAGSTVTGVVGSDAVIQNQNSSTGATCKSGDVTAVNSLTVNAGPSVVILPPPPPPPNGEDPPPLGDADLRIRKSTEDMEVEPGGTITYDIRVGNAPGSAPAENVEWTDEIPAGTTFVSLTAPAGWTCDTPAVGGTGTVSCSRDGPDPMPAGSEGIADFVLVVAVDEDAEPGTRIVNVASVTADNPDPNPGNNTDDARSGVVEAEVVEDPALLTVDKAFASGTAANNNHTTTWTTTVDNDPTAGTAFGVVFVDTAPAGWTLNTGTIIVPTGWDCLTLSTSTELRCTKAEMAPTETATFTYTFGITGSNPTAVTNEAAADWTNDDGSTDSASDTACASRAQAVWGPATCAVNP